MGRSVNPSKLYCRLGSSCFRLGWFSYVLRYLSSVGKDYKAKSQQIYTSQAVQAGQIIVGRFRFDKHFSQLQLAP